MRVSRCISREAPLPWPRCPRSRLRAVRSNSTCQRYISEPLNPAALSRATQVFLSRGAATSIMSRRVRPARAMVTSPEIRRYPDVHHCRVWTQGGECLRRPENPLKRVLWTLRNFLVLRRLQGMRKLVRLVWRRRELRKSRRLRYRGIRIQGKQAKEEKKFFF